MRNIGSRRGRPMRWLRALALVVLAVVVVRLGAGAGSSFLRSVAFDRPVLGQQTDTMLAHVADDAERGVVELRPNRRSREPVTDHPTMVGVLTVALLAAAATTRRRRDERPTPAPRAVPVRGGRGPPVIAL